VNGEIFYTLRDAQVLIEQWRQHYNRVRPHSALGYRPPAPEAQRPAAMQITLSKQVTRYEEIGPYAERVFRQTDPWGSRSLL